METRVLHQGFWIWGLGLRGRLDISTHTSRVRCRADPLEVSLLFTVIAQYLIVTNGLAMSNLQTLSTTLVWTGLGLMPHLSTLKTGKWLARVLGVSLSIPYEEKGFLSLAPSGTASVRCKYRRDLCCDKYNATSQRQFQTGLESYH